MSDARVTARLEGPDYRTVIRAGRHQLLTDEPESLGGGDAGPDAVAMMLGALGACSAVTMKMYAARKGWPLTGATVTLAHRRERGKMFIDRIIHLEGELTTEQRERILAIAKVCPVSKALSEGAIIESRLDDPEAP